MSEAAVSDVTINNSNTILDDSDVNRWYVIRTHSKQEDRADSNLKVLGIQIFNPKIREHRYNQFTNIPAYVIKPLFPSYIFARFKVNDLYHKIRFTRGVFSVVSFGKGPTPIDEGIITMIQSNIGEVGFIKIGQEIVAGDKVIVKDGLLKSFVGIFEREMRDADRVRILLETVSYQAHIEVERKLVEKVRIHS